MLVPDLAEVDADEKFKEARGRWPCQSAPGMRAWCVRTQTTVVRTAMKEYRAQPDTYVCTPAHAYAGVESLGLVARVLSFNPHVDALEDPILALIDQQPCLSNRQSAPRAARRDFPPARPHRERKTGG